MIFIPEYVACSLFLQPINVKNCNTFFFFGSRTTTLGLVALPMENVSIIGLSSAFYLFISISNFLFNNQSFLISFKR